MVDHNTSDGSFKHPTAPYAVNYAQMAGFYVQGSGIGATATRQDVEGKFTLKRVSDFVWIWHRPGAGWGPRQ